MNYLKRTLNTWQLLYSSLRNQVPAVLLYVLASEGSSPGRAGFILAVDVHGLMQGSIGGGIMEHKFVELAKQRMNEECISPTVIKQFHDKEAAKNQSGMICSGQQTILLYPVTNKDLVPISNIIQCLEDGQDATLQLSPGGIVFSSSIIPEHYQFEFSDDDNWRYSERLGFGNQLFIVGGGHCSLALTAIMSTMDFFITVIDDRKELNTLVENEYAHKRCFVKSYEELRTIIPGDNNTYIVVMTIGYRTDYIALEALKDKQYKYLGVLGSSAKITRMLTDFKNNHEDSSLLNRIHGPVGISINSQTPAEIAVSIAAEIISIKNS